VNLPIIPKAVTVSNPADTNLLGTKSVAAVPNKFPKNPFKHKGSAIINTLNNNWDALSGFLVDTGSFLVRFL